MPDELSNDIIGRLTNRLANPPIANLDTLFVDLETATRELINKDEQIATLHSDLNSKQAQLDAAGALPLAWTTQVTTQSNGNIEIIHPEILPLLSDALERLGVNALSSVENNIRRAIQIIEGLTSTDKSDTSDTLNTRGNL
jgi:hypothetical protein